MLTSMAALINVEEFCMLAIFQSYMVWSEGLMSASSRFDAYFAIG